MSQQPTQDQLEQYRERYHDDQLIEGNVPERWVPIPLRVGAAWSWRILVVAVVLLAVCWAISYVRIIVVPVMIAILLTALLRPFVEWLGSRGWPRGLAVAVVEVGLIVLVTGMIWLAALQFSSTELAAVGRDAQALWMDFKDWLRTSPLHITDQDLDTYMKNATEAFRREASTFVNGAIKVGSTAGHIGAGILLTLFSTLFFLLDSRTIFRWLLNLVPSASRDAFRGGLRQGWATLTAYVKVQILVAAIDAVGIGIGAFFVGVPFVIPMSLLVFLGSFIPFVGAIFTGALVCVLALFTKGWLAAIIMLAIVLLVQQIEGHVLQPFVMGTAVKVHPLAVVLAVATGSLIAGIAGAFFAVPVVAVVNKMIGYFRAYADQQTAAASASAAAAQAPTAAKTKPGNPGD